MTLDLVYYLRMIINFMVASTLIVTKGLKMLKNGGPVSVHKKV